MSSVIRVYVEKREGFDVEARHMLADLKDNLGIRELEALRLLNRYDIQGLTEDEFRQARGTVFSEPNADKVYDEEFPLGDGWTRCLLWNTCPASTTSGRIPPPQCVQLLTQGRAAPGADRPGRAV